MIKVFAIGRLVGEPETKTLSGANATTVTNFRIAVDREYKRDGQPSSDFFDCQAWGKTGENIAKFFHKGNRIGLAGRLENNEYTNKEGQKVTRARITVDNFDFCESKNGGASEGGASTPDFMDVSNAVGEELPFI